MADRQAAAIAQAISNTTPVTADVAKLQAIAVAGVFQIIISHAGRLTQEGRSQAEIADELHPIVENVLDELDHWLSLRTTGTAPTTTADLATAAEVRLGQLHP